MSSIAAGTVVGHKYRLDAPIGQGGMASVWRATHTTLESSVAVKFLEMFGGDRDKLTKRFLQEAKLAAQLEHRNVVRVLDFGVLDDGQPFMVMELLSGETLADRIESDEPPTTLELLELIAQVLGGLAAVHDHGIVHRDMKPENIFLVRDADGDYPKLVDFGISLGSRDARMTETGAVVGTPAYMSPEQARGLPDIDARTDLFSVGVILREAFTGELPFECEHVGDILIRVATEDVPTLERDRPDLPQALVDLVDKALARERAYRWSDAREMRAAALEIADRLAGADQPHLSHSRLPSARLASRVSLATVMEPESSIESAAPVVIAAKNDRGLKLALAGAFVLVAALLGVVVMLMIDADASSADVETPTLAPTEPTAPRTTRSTREEPAPLPEPRARTTDAPTRPAAPTPTLTEPTRAAAEPAPRPTGTTPPRTPPARPAQRVHDQARTAVEAARRQVPVPTPAPTPAGSAPSPGRRGFLRDLDY